MTAEEKADFQPFLMERMMSKWENVVDYNLSESGVHPMTVRELVDDPAVIEELLSAELGYAQANGVIELRERIAALYPGATPDNVLVTVGCAEANFITLQTMLRPGEEMVMMLPNYMQIWGIAHNLGFRVNCPTICRSGASPTTWASGSSPSTSNRNAVGLPTWTS
jgi:aspartate/methionine/tyrosine aminotransferase